MPAEMQNRIYGLDTYRAILLLAGPLIHSAPAVAAELHLGTDLYGGMIRASALFRMPVFFFIAGFLAAHAQAKQIRWTERRLTQLCVPLLSTWLLFVLPLQFFKIGVFKEGGYNPVHLWFLMDLALFSWIFSRPMISSAIDKACEILGAKTLLIGFFVVSGMLSALRYPIAHIPVDVWTSNFLQSPAVAIYYLGGMVVQKHAGLFQLIRRKPVALGGVVLFLIAFPVIESLQGYLLPQQHRFLKLAIAGTSGVVAAGMCCAIMASAIAMHWRPQFLSRLSRASYSIYLLHLPVIGIAAPLLVSSSISVPANFVMLSAISFGASWLLHEVLIQRSAALHFLFNGVAPRPASAPMQTSARANIPTS
jgi:fucose 4-O-acetylase-like acetyltransferase